MYISQHISFARVCGHVDDFNARNKCLTAKLFKQGYWYHKLSKAFLGISNCHTARCICCLRLCFVIVLKHDFVNHDDSLTSKVIMRTD